jgi:hypothetical protein|tara:strand:+ start:4180 stop:4443 length:264 start_codon:yes stop_codon:yes gene_type:complete
MDKWQVIQGRKSEKDKILLYQGKAVSFRDVAMMCIFFMENEDILYPPSRGLKGAEMFKDYIKEVLENRKVPTDSKYAIRKNHGVVKV